MKKMFYLVFALSQVFLALSYGEPMESFKNYNVILVHGAGGRYFGMDCDNDSKIKEAWTYLEPNQDTTKTEQENYLDIIGGYGDKALPFMKDRASSAEDMDLNNDGLRHWLTEDIFENDKSVIYLQRPFTNPANSPINNAKELGDRKWQVNNKCEFRRSLIEEAQEVRAKGRENLGNLRNKGVENRNALPPSRNILIAHSMGGVASREYVQGTGYNNDVDKIITLDSPHEGTGALNLLVEVSDLETRLKIAALNADGTTYLATAGLLVAAAKDMPAATIALYSLIPSLITTGGDVTTYGLGQILIKVLDKHYQPDDPLTPYIDPTRSNSDIDGIINLKNRSYTDSLPMMRLLYGENSMTFSDPAILNAANMSTFPIPIPKALMSSYYNLYSQYYGGGSRTVNFINSASAYAAGMIFGVTIGEHGTTLIPQWSGMAKDTKSLNDPSADVIKRSYNGHVNGSLDDVIKIIAAEINAIAILIVAVNEIPFLPHSVASSIKTGIAFAASPALAAEIGVAITTGIMDLADSHEAPLLKEYQNKWFGASNSYTKITGGQETYKPYQMEEFLYEKPFVNVHVKSSYGPDWKDQKSDTLGLYIGDSLKPMHIDSSLSTSLKFKSSADWETVGAKKERWAITTGVGNEKIPIRHADRYPMPSIMVKDYIEKYEFEVDDLMPHRLRQIRINFNFNEDLAWECDVSKAEGDNTACVVYKRTPASNKWDTLRIEKHPVEKNGLFVFEPSKYDYNQLGIIQKDNQNTVTISTVNKIGLKNSQRFFYLFRATADLLEPAWPLRNIKTSSLNGFEAYISTLGYQNIVALGGKEYLSQDPQYNENYEYTDSTAMSNPLQVQNGYLLKSLGDYSKFHSKEGRYVWQTTIKTGDTSDPLKSSISDMTIPFTLDTTPPKTNLNPENDIFNADSTTFLARFENDSEIDESLRLVALFLKNSYGQTIATAKFTEVLASSFSIKLPDFKNTQNQAMNNLPDGKYKIVSYAFDGSTNSLEQYNLLNNVIGGSASLYDLFENNKVKQGIIASRDTADFIVDSQAPEFDFSLSESILNLGKLLKITLNVSDSNGKDSATVRFSVSFAEGKDTLRLGDTLLLRNGIRSKEWNELESMAIPDGDYEVFIDVWDESGNHKRKKYDGLLRIDRTPPDIVGVWSDIFISTDSLDNYSASMEVKQQGYEKHISEMQCRYRINNGEWQNIAEKSSKKIDTLRFNMDRNIVGNEHGKRHLEAGCTDWAGNFASKLDLFHVGARFPVIIHPKDVSVEEPVIAIRGSAPTQSSDNLPGSYQLEWRREGDTSWQTNGMDVGASRRYSADLAWVSKSTQPADETDLGFFDMRGLEGGNYELLLSVRNCDSCKWRKDTVSFHYWPKSDTVKEKLLFTKSNDTFTPGEGSLSLSLQIADTESKDYRANIYAHDSKGNALFFASTNSLTASPYVGKSDSLEGNGVWFWSENDVYYVRWKGLPKDEEIAIHYTKGKFDESICGNGCSLKDTALASNEEALGNANQNIAREILTPPGLDKAMIFNGTSGEFSFKSDNALWLKLKKNADTTHKVYLGKGGSPLEYVVKYTGTGIQIKKDFYGFYYKWNGMSSTGRYPQGKAVTFYAEALENIIGGEVLRDSINVLLTMPDLKIISDTAALDAFYVIRNSADSGSVLGNKMIHYGIAGRDAIVNAYIKKANGSIVKNLLTNAPHAASGSDKAYPLSWNGEDNNGHLVLESGSYYFELVATESGVSGSPQSDILRRNFEISLAPGVHYVKDEPGETPVSSLSLLHAKPVNAAYWQYAPAADYLVEANAVGKWLPDSLRNIEVEWTAGGTQNIYGYPPQRYSLAVKRQRENLPLVIVAQAKLAIVKLYCATGNKENQYIDTILWRNTLQFDKNSLSNYIYVSFDADDYGDVGRGFAEDTTFNKIILYAFLLKDAEEKNSKNLIENVSPVWKKEINLPRPSDNHRYENDINNRIDSLSSKDISCEPIEPTASSEGQFCTYAKDENGKLKDPDNYNPNKNLFDIIIKPMNEYFYEDRGKIHNDCISRSARRFQFMDLEIKFTIPDKDYWNVEYGYDNLVNRTIRFDQTNKTMYGDNGYLKTLHDSTNIPVRDSIFFDGENWHSNYNYGLLTPFEMHRYPFVSVSKLPSNNAFAFPDETADPKYQYPSYYHAKYYNFDNGGTRFRALIAPQNQMASVALYSDGDPVSTKTAFGHGTVNIYVSMDAAPESFQKDMAQIAYPAKDWTPQNTCPSHNTPWLDSAKNEADCKKFYKAGSKIHYDVGDFTDDEWKEAMLTNSGDIQVIANIGNSAKPLSPFATLGNPNENQSICGNLFSMMPSNYDNNKFYIETGCDSYLSGVEATYTPKIMNTADTTLYSFANNSLYINALDWNNTFVLPQKKYPERDSSITLQIGNEFQDEWVKELKLTSAKANYLNSSEHTHFKANHEGDSLIKLSVKSPPDSVRPSEFIAVKGTVPKNSNWKLSYLNGGALHTIAKKQTDSLFEWFNVNTLQGNTSILLQWGGEGNLLNIRKLDLDIGHEVTQNNGGTVQSLFGEVSVWFPPGSMEDTIVTVRTADAKDYAFTTSNNTALVGPVIEVLPAKKFSDTLALPRIKARITHQELDAMSLSPDDVRLYKIDTENKKFVALENMLRGFDKEPDCLTNTVYNKCEGYNENWSYLLISAETRSFSIFAVLDTATAKRLNEEPASKPDSVPSQIICSIPQDTLWLGLDNGYLEMFQECNQLVMGTLQLRKNGSIVTERSQVSTEPMRWDGRIGLNKISNGEYTSRYITVSPLGSETQTLGPTILTDPARPQISDWSIEETSELLDRIFTVNAKAKDDESGINSVLLKWDLGGVTDSVSLIADSAGYVSYKITLNRNSLSQCLGCKLTLSLIAEDFGHNNARKEWTSGSLYPYPADLALWYPALEGGGRTAREYTKTGHDLDLLMQTPWHSASGLYFKESEDKAPGKGQVNFGSTDSYTLEAWLRPGYPAISAWQRVLGFNSVTGKRIELQVNGEDIRLLDGFETWTVPNVLLRSKEWTHLVVAVDANYAHFYADGELAGTVTAVPSERLWYGNFSLGTEENIPSFTGHIMQVRFYKRALGASEAQALFRGVGAGEDSRVEITLANELDLKIYGFERGFSCAVPGSSYWGTPGEASLPWKVWVVKGGSYRVFLYARSAQPGNKIVKAGLGGSLQSGTAALESVWRPIELQGINLPLQAGFNNLELRIPAGLDIAGIAISDNPGLLPSQISWKSEGAITNSSVVDAQVRFEGYPEPSMIRPRIRLQNTGSTAIYGPKVRYYFRGEDPAQVQASKFYPQEGELAVRQEGDNLGYAEWSFPETTVLPPGQLLFWGEGPHFGLHNTNYIPWVVKDDPSFTDIIVLDAENRVLSGSCFENEAPLITVPIVQVLARDSRANDNQASQLYIKLENIGQIPIRDYEVRYSFYVSGGIAPVLDVYDMQGLSASLKNLGSGRWQVAITGSASLGPGISWANPAQFALHLPNWQAGWQTGDDPSYEGLSGEWALAKGVEVFDAAGNRIYGKEPVWSSSSESSSSSVASTSSAQVRVMAKETKAHESNASAVRFYVENLGAESISGFEVRYWFSVSSGKNLEYQVYSNTQFLANMVKETANLYSARFVYAGSPLAPNAKTEWGEGLELSVHHSDWSAWDKESDFSHKGLGIDFSEAHYITVYDSEGNIIWGTEPMIPEEMDYPAIEFTRQPDGLLVSVHELSNIRLDLVNAAGMPQKFLYQGVLNVGEHLIPMDWSAVDLARTYLVARLNGRISSQLLSKLGN
ncbi:MAG: hypothetical protein LBQ76_09155 [Candidatus Fibromonas sp.]|jgi:hypothetical protein|nr:hypothetical protein [Candidatus Fibromonas sp.]